MTELEQLGAGVVHVWTIPLDRTNARGLRDVLSESERSRADRFMRAEHTHRFVIAHGSKRRILAVYAEQRPEQLRFVEGPHGKPALDGSVSGVEFNLSHSGDLALIAIARGYPVGVDVERRDPTLEHLDLAERFFSPAERAALQALSPDEEAVTTGFFACWSRKEAYLKATGYGISRGLHHFDVTLVPGIPARLIADRLDPQAVTRWELADLPMFSGYSAALVTVSPIHSILVRDIGDRPWPQ